MLNSPRIMSPLVICILGLSVFFGARGQAQERPTQAAFDLAHILDVDPDSLTNDANAKRIRTLIGLLGDQRPTVNLPGPTGAPTIASEAGKKLTFDYGRSALPDLTARIEKETDRDVFAQLTKVVSWIAINDKRVVAALCRRGRSNDPVIRRHVIEALAQIGASGQEADAILLAALKDPDLDVQLAGLLAATKRTSAVPGATAILREMLSDRSPRMVSFSADTGGFEEVRVFAAYALGRIGRAEPRVVAELEQLFAEEYKPMRIAAAVAHARLTGTRKGAKVLFNIVSDEGELKRLRTEATKGLIHTEQLDVKDLDILQPLLKNERGVLGSYLLNAVVVADSKNKMKTLSKYSENNDWLIRMAAMELLVVEYRKSSKYLSKLIALVENPKAYWSVKLDAMEALSGFGGEAKSALPHLRRVIEADGAESMYGSAAKRAIRSIEAANGRFP